MSKLITSVLWSVEQSLDKNSKERTQGNIGVSSLCTTQDSDNKYVKRIERDAQGNITSVTGSALDNYNDNSSTPITGKGVKEALSTVTVKVDDSTTALKYLKVTSKPSDSIYGSNFNSGLKSESPSGHSNYSYLSVNCGNGLRIVDSGADIGKLAMKSATDNEIGGIMTGYQPAANTKDYAVQVDANGRAHVEVPWSYTLSKATDQALGGIMTGYQPAANTKDYAVQLDSNGRAHVEVPWSFTLSKATDQALGGIMTGYQPAANTKDYAVQLDSNGRAHVSVPWTDTDNDTKNTVGVGTATSSANAVYKFPFVKGTSTEDYQRSYTALGSYNMLSVEETTDATSYLLKFYGNLVPKVNSTVPDGSLMVYSDLHGELIKTSSCGDGLRSIYIDSDGAPKMCRKLYDGGSSANLSHDTSYNSLYIDDNIVDPTTNENVRFIGSYNFGINNKFIKGHAAPGNDPAVADRWVQDKVGSFLFGDGLSTTQTTHQHQSFDPPIDKYWGAVFNKNPNTTNGLNPVIVEAPSILYAMTTINKTLGSGYSYEVYNRRRITRYDICTFMRVADARSSSLYINNTVLNDDNNRCAGIAYVPPRHWAFVSGVLEENDHGLLLQPATQIAYFHITDQVIPSTDYTNANALCVFDWIQGHSESSNPVYTRHPFSFFAFNPDYNTGKFIQVTINHSMSGTVSGVSVSYEYTISKQIMIFKEPDYCGGIEDEGGTGGAAQLYDAVYDNYPNNWVLPHLSST